MLKSENIPVPGMHTHHSDKSVFCSLDILRMAGDVALTLISNSMMNSLPVWNSQRMLSPSCLEVMPTQLLRITPEHHGEDSWNMPQESAVSLLSIPLSVGLTREMRGLWAGYQPLRRRRDKSSFIVASVVAAHVGREGLCLACYSVLMSADLAASRSRHGSAVASSDKVRPWWEWWSSGAGCSCYLTPGYFLFFQ